QYFSFQKKTYNIKSNQLLFLIYIASLAQKVHGHGDRHTIIFVNLINALVTCFLLQVYHGIITMEQSPVSLLRTITYRSDSTNYDSK
ncbi:hypothetical protein L9F63_002648, partial [Diploptera punctata]